MFLPSGPYGRPSEITTVVGDVRTWDRSGRRVPGEPSEIGRTIASGSDVRALGPVGEDTDVHLPGTYNRSFPETNVTRAYEYLNVERTGTPGRDSGPLGQRGFGLGAGLAAVAMLGAARLASRRRQD